MTYKIYLAISTGDIIAHSMFIFDFCAGITLISTFFHISDGVLIISCVLGLHLGFHVVFSILCQEKCAKGFTVVESVRHCAGLHSDF